MDSRKLHLPLNLPLSLILLEWPEDQAFETKFGCGEGVQQVRTHASIPPIFHAFFVGDPQPIAPL
jgi:hypothetical protein